jgi:hypothetical protein
MKKRILSGTMLVLVAGTCLATSARALQLTVSPAVWIGGSVTGVNRPLIDESGPHMAVDPYNPNHLAVVYSLGNTHEVLYDSTGIQATELQAEIVSSSYDGGLTWSRAALPRWTLCTCDENGKCGENGTIGDPFIAISSGGRVTVTGGWVSYDPTPSPTHSDLRLFVSRSSDGGATFSLPVEPERTVNPEGNQRAPLLFDRRYPDRLNVAFERLHYVNEGPLSYMLGGNILGLGGSIGVAHSEDGGATFPFVFTAYTVPPGEELATIGLLRSGPDFVLITSVVEDSDYLASAGPVPDPVHKYAVPQYLRSVRWSENQLVPTVLQDDIKSIGTYWDGGYNGIPYAAAAPDGTLYVIWGNLGTKGVFVARSGDAGRSWTGGDAAAFTTAGGAIQPALAVRDDGVVGVFYYAFVPGSSNKVTPYVAVSPNGVDGWVAKPIAKPFDLSPTSLTGGSNDGRDPGPGPYQDIVALPDGFGVSVTLGNQLNVPAGQERVFYIKVKVKR